MQWTLDWGSAAGKGRGIMKLAGGPGDRWFRRKSGGVPGENRDAKNAKAAATKPGREESPDTVLRHVDRSAFILHRNVKRGAVVGERTADVTAMTGERSTELLTGQRAW